MINEIFFGKFKDGRPYARLCVATTHTNNHTKKGKTTSSEKHTVWIYDTDLMDKYRDVLTTGSHVFVEGTLCFNEYTDKHGFYGNPFTPGLPLLKTLIINK